MSANQPQDPPGFPTASRGLDAAFSFGQLTAIRDVVLPALVEIGERWERAHLAVGHEHFASHLIRAHKPEAAIYEYVERATGLAPSALLFFDDAAPNIAAAQSRGWNAQLIDVAVDPVTQITATLQRYGVL